MTNNGTLAIEKVTNAEARQAPLMKFTIHCVIEGFPVEITGEGRADMRQSLTD